MNEKQKVLRLIEAMQQKEKDGSLLWCVAEDPAQVLRPAGRKRQGGAASPGTCTSPGGTGQAEAQALGHPRLYVRGRLLCGQRKNTRP